MPVDRIRRDAAAQAVAGYLRGEVDLQQLTAKFRDLEAAPAESRNPDEYLDGVLEGWPQILDGFGHHGEGIAKEEWPFFLRGLAFLKSDLAREERAKLKEPAFEDVDRPRQVLEARWHVLVLLLALIPSWLISWWIVAGVSVASYIVFWHLGMRRRQRVFEASKKIDRDEYYPFPSLNDWKEHEALLEPFGLPTYEASRFCLPRVSPFRHMLHVAGSGMATGALYLIFAFMSVFTVIMWPLLIVATALGSPKPDKS